MTTRSIVSSLLLLALSPCLTSCGGDPEIPVRNDTSVGRQLTELEAARQQGLVTNEEYVRLKKNIIKKNS